MHQAEILQLPLRSLMEFYSRPRWVEPSVLSPRSTTTCLPDATPCRVHVSAIEVEDDGHPRPHIGQSHWSCRWGYGLCSLAATLDRALTSATEVDDGFSSRYHAVQNSTSATEAEDDGHPRPHQAGPLQLPLGSRMMFFRYHTGQSPCFFHRGRG